MNPTDHLDQRKWNATTDDGTRHRVEAVVETLANQCRPGESLRELAHDARNMVTALSLYCDLLREPGVLQPAYLHFGHELNLVVAASRRLVEGLAAIAERSSGGSRHVLPEEPRLPFPDFLPVGSHLRPDHSRPNLARQDRPKKTEPDGYITDLSEELKRNLRLLQAMAGPGITVEMAAGGGLYPVKLRGEDLTRLLVNLLKNASEAMPGGGQIKIGLSESPNSNIDQRTLLLSVEDTGSGIEEGMYEVIFEAGYTTKSLSFIGRKSLSNGREKRSRGLGLAIARSMIEAAGGQIRARKGDLAGARFEVELPVFP